MIVERDAASIVRGQTPLLLMTTALAIVTGVVLRREEEVLFASPWLLALIPLVNALGGNLGSVLGARVTSALHVGTLEPRLRRGELSGHLGVTLVAGTLVYALLTALVFLVAPRVDLFPALSLGAVAALVLGSGLVLTLGVIGLSLTAAFIAFRQGLDPDDIVVPVVTNAADLLGVVVLFNVAGVVL